MKKFSKIIGIALATALVTAGISTLTACAGKGGSDVSGTYTYENTDKSDIASYVLHTGYFSGVAGTASLKDTLILNADGTYSLNKYLDYGDDNKAGEPVYLTYTYYGEYTHEGNKVVLKACTRADYEDHTGERLSASGFAASAKTGVTDPTETVGAYGIILFNTFNTEYLYLSMSCVDQEVELEGNKVKFAKLSSGEDDEELEEDDLNETTANGVSSIDTANGNAMNIHYVAGVNANLNSDFAIEAAVWSPLVAGGYGTTATDVVMQAASTDAAATLTVYGDGHYTYHWAQGTYSVDESGVWTFANYTLTLTYVAA